MRFLRLDGRPRPVRVAVYLLLVDSCAILAASCGTAAVHHGSATSGVLFAVGIRWTVSVAVVLAVAHGRRWARTFYLLVVSWAVVSFPIGLSVHRGLGHATLAWNVLSLGVYAAGAILLLLPESRRWFAVSAAASRGRPAAS